MRDQRTDLQGRAYAKVDEVKFGDVIQVDAGFPCIEANSVHVVDEDDTAIFIPCQHGKHYLDGQISDDGKTYVGVYPMLYLNVAIEAYRRQITGDDRPPDWKPRPDHVAAMQVAVDAILVVYSIDVLKNVERISTPQAEHDEQLARRKAEDRSNE